MRNSINYRQSHGTWFPYNKLADPAVLEYAARAWKSHPSPGTNTAQSELDNVTRLYMQLTHTHKMYTHTYLGVQFIEVDNALSPEQDKQT